MRLSALITMGRAFIHLLPTIMVFMPSVPAMQAILTEISVLMENTCVCSMAKLTIKSPVTLYGSTKIIVEPNGELIIDGGVLPTADIELKVGSKLVLKNGGSILMRNGKDFIAPIGASVIIEDGMLK